MFVLAAPWPRKRIIDVSLPLSLSVLEGFIIVVVFLYVIFVCVRVTSTSVGAGSGHARRTRHGRRTATGFREVDASSTSCQTSFRFPDSRGVQLDGCGDAAVVRQDRPPLQ